jgi:hypothetical protein
MPCKMLRYPCHAPQHLCDLSKIATCLMVEPRHHFKIIRYKYHQKLPLPRWAWGATVGTLQTGYPCVQDLKDQPYDSRSVPNARRPWLRHVPEAQSMPPTRRGLWCLHVPYGAERATHQERALMLPRAPRHRARHPTGEGSRVTTCLVAPGRPPTQEGSGVAT